MSGRDTVLEIIGESGPTFLDGVNTIGEMLDTQDKAYTELHTKFWAMYPFAIARWMELDAIDQKNKLNEPGIDLPYQEARVKLAENVLNAARINTRRLWDDEFNQKWRNRDEIYS